MQSMTGFGQSQGEVFGCLCIVEIKSVNHRFLETKIRLPETWESSLIERQINLQIRKKIQRGSLQVHIRMQESVAEKNSVSVNTALAQAYAKTWFSLRQSLTPLFPKMESTNEHESFEALLRFVLSQPKVLQETKIQENDPWIGVEPLFNQALDHLISERIREGKELQQEIQKWLIQLNELSLEAEQYSQTVISQFQTRFEERVQSLLQTSAPLEKESIIREVAFLVAGWDITEEFHRLRVHIKECLELCGKPFSVGKQLDFFVQELHREINTLGAKAHSTEISSIVVSMKTILERIREQVQNVE